VECNGLNEDNRAAKEEIKALKIDLKRREEVHTTTRSVRDSSICKITQLQKEARKLKKALEQYGTDYSMASKGWSSSIRDFEKKMKKGNITINRLHAVETSKNCRIEQLEAVVRRVERERDHQIKVNEALDVTSQRYVETGKLREKDLRAQLAELKIDLERYKGVHAAQNTLSDSILQQNLETSKTSKEDLRGRIKALNQRLNEALKDASYAKEKIKFVRETRETAISERDELAEKLANSEACHPNNGCETADRLNSGLREACLEAAEAREQRDEAWRSVNSLEDQLKFARDSRLDSVTDRDRKLQKSEEALQLITEERDSLFGRFSHEVSDNHELRGTLARVNSDLSEKSASVECLKHNLSATAYKHGETVRKLDVLTEENKRLERRRKQDQDEVKSTSQSLRSQVRSSSEDAKTARAARDTARESRDAQFEENRRLRSELHALQDGRDVVLEVWLEVWKKLQPLKSAAQGIQRALSASQDPTSALIGKVSSFLDDLDEASKAGGL
jgi:chromosome segregation ATPase